MTVINQQQLGTRTIYQHQSGNSRYYTVSGDEGLEESEKLASVSTVLGVISKPAILGWAINLTKQGVDHNEERDKAADQGKELHTAIQTYLTEGEHPDIPRYSITITAMLHRWITWYKQSGITITATEKMVYHPVLKYAGTLDALGHDEQGDLVVLDWKSGNLWNETASQIADYGAAIRYDVVEDIEVRGLVVGLKNTPAEVKEVDDMGNTAITMFTSAMYIYKNLKDTKAVSVWRK